MSLIVGQGVPDNIGSSEQILQYVMAVIFNTLQEAKYIIISHICERYFIEIKSNTKMLSVAFNFHL